MLRLGGASLVLLPLLSGCIGGSAQTAATPASQPEAQAPVIEVSSTEGAIEGIVVDPSILPVAGAHVQLLSATEETELSNATSGAGGEFGFSRLQPATYRVRSTAEGYSATTLLVQVRAGEVTRATVPLSDVPSLEPYVVLYIQTGILRCGYALVLYSDSCGIQQVMGPSRLRIFYNVTAGHQAVVVETLWSQKDIYMDYWIYAQNMTRSTNTTKYWDYVGDAIGTPILRKEFTPGQEPKRTQIRSDYRAFPPTNWSFQLRVETYYDGAYQRDFNQTLYEACKYILGYCAGVGVALDFKFTQYVTAFIHAAPPAPRDYSAVPDQ